MKKIKFVIVIVLGLLILTSISANAINLKNININGEKIQTVDDDVEVYVGVINVDCQYDDDLAIDIDVPESPHRDINPQNSEKINFKFYLDWHIRNQQGFNFEEKWYFEIVIKDGSSPDSSVIDRKTLTVNDGLFGPEKTDGKLYSKEISIDREDFEKDDFFNEPETKKFRAEIRGAYYHNSGNTDIDDDDLWTVTRIDLGNEDPSKPTLTGDINDGGKGSFETTYHFTASGSTDPDGDQITKYDFDFHDGTVDQVYPSGGVATASHKWADQGEKKVTVYARDRFGGMSDGAEIAFTLPIEKNTIEQNSKDSLEKFTCLTRLLEKLIEDITGINLI